MANDYIPRPDARFHAWQNNFVTYINGHPGDLGLAAVARHAQDGGRDGLEGAVRPLVRGLQGRPAVDASERE